MRRVLAALAVILSALSANSTMLNPDIINMPGSRGAAMAGAFSAVADDYSAFLWNPAGLVLLERVQIAGHYDHVNSGTRYNFSGSLAVPTDDFITASLSYSHTGFNPEQFLIDTLYLSVAAYPESGGPLSTGVTFKFTGVNREEWGVSASAFMIDMGILYFPDILDKKTRFSAAVRDFDAYLTWNTGEKNRLPTTYTMGGAYIFDKSAVAAIDLGIREKSVGQHTLSAALGAEKYFSHPQAGTFGIRGGVNYDGAYDPAFYAAFGLSYKRDIMAIDYAYGPDIRKFGETHKISAVFMLGPPVKIREAFKSVPVKPKETVTVAPVMQEAASTVYPDIKFTVSSKYLNQQRPVTLIIDNQPMSLYTAVTKLEIINAQGKAVRTISQPGRVPREFIWNALDDSALPVKDGDYNAVLTVTDGDRVLWKKVRVLTVDTSAPACSISVSPKRFAASPASLIKNAVITIEPQPYDTAKWELTLNDMKGNTVRKFSGEGAPGKLYFTGKDAMNEYLKDGEYVFIFDIEDFAGNTYRAKDTIRISSELVKFTVKTENRIFTPGENSALIGPVFTDIADVSSWSLQVTDLNGNLIREFKNRGAGTAPASWNGTDEANEYVREGEVFKYRIIVAQKSGMQSFAEGYLQTTLPEFRATGINLILAAIKFPSGEQSVPVEDYNTLSQAATAIKQYAKDYIVFIRSYSSDTGDSVRNFNLSVERALQVADYLSEAKEIPRDRLRIYAMGDGSFAIGASAQSDAAEKGARVEVELLSK